jgi:hypothetical protein
MGNEVQSLAFLDFRGALVERLLDEDACCYRCSDPGIERLGCNRNRLDEDGDMTSGHVG